MRLKIANEYGSVDVRGKLPGGYVHVPGKRLQPLCRRLGIRYAEALIGWSEYRGHYSPELDGVVVHVRVAPRLLAAIAVREQRSRAVTPEQRAQREQSQARQRQRRQQRDIDEFAALIRECYPGCPCPEHIAAHACEIGSGRVGRSSRADDRVTAAVVAHIRHECTDYEQLIREYDGDRDFARRCVRDQISEILQAWEWGPPKTKEIKREQSA